MVIYFPGDNRHSSCFQNCYSILETVSSLTGLTLGLFTSQEDVLAFMSDLKLFCPIYLMGEQGGGWQEDCKKFHTHTFLLARKNRQLQVSECPLGLKIFVLPVQSPKDDEIFFYIVSGHFFSDYNSSLITEMQLKIPKEKIDRIFTDSPVLNEKKFSAVISQLQNLSHIYYSQRLQENQEERISRTFNIISDVAGKLTGGFHLKELLCNIAVQTASAFETDIGGVSLWEEGVGIKEEFVSLQDFKADFSEILQILKKTGKTFFSYEISADNRITSLFHSPSPVRSLLSVPMKVGERFVGALNLISTRSNRLYQKKEIESAEALASELALVVEIVRLYDISRKRAIELQRSRDELKTYFTKIGTALSTSLDIGQLLKLILELSLQLTHSPMGSIYLMENKKITRYMVAINENNELKWFDSREILNNKKVSSYLGIPLEIKGETRGLLNVMDHEKREYSQEEVEMLNLFARHAGLAVENAWLFQQEMKKARESTTLYTAVKSIRESTNLDEVLAQSSYQLLSVAEVDRCLILLLDYKKLELYTAVALGVSPEQKEFFSYYRIPVDEINDEIWESLVQGEHVVIKDIPPDCPTMEKFFLVFPTNQCLLIPLISREQLTGIIYLDDSRMSHQFSDNLINIIKTLGIQIAGAIQRARMMEQMEAGLEQLKALHLVSTAVSGTLSLPKVFEMVVDKACHLIDAPASSILTWDEATQDYVMKASYGLSGTLSDLEFQKLISDKSAKRKRYMTYYISADPEGDDPIIPNTLESAGMGGYISIPLIARKKVVGVLNCFCKTEDKFDRQEIRLLRSFANQSAIAVENAGLYQTVKNKVRELATVFEVGKSITSSLEMGRVLEEICSSVVKVMDADSSSIMILDEERQELNIIKTWGLGKYRTGDRIKVGSGIAGIAAKTGRPMVLHDDKNSPSPYKFPQQLKNAGIHTILSVPLKVRDRVIGLINLYKQAIYHFSPNEINLLTTMANQAAISLENARLYNEEFNIAQIIQKNLMPSKVFTFEGVDIGNIYIPSEKLSGDYFEIIRLNHKKFGTVISDVSGKGTDAAIYNARAKYILKAYAAEKYSPDQLLTLLNKVIEEETAGDKFISMVYMEIDLEKMELTYSSAGHEPFILWKDNEKTAKIMDNSDLLIGVFPHTRYHQHTITINKGDIVILYTDGITEARSREGEFFGQERIIELVATNFHLSSQALANKIYTSVQKFTRRKITDDFSLMVIKV